MCSALLVSGLQFTAPKAPMQSFQMAYSCLEHPQHFGRGVLLSAAPLLGGRRGTSLTRPGSEDRPLKGFPTA